MTGRNLHQEWLGRTPNSMPSVKVFLRLYEAQNGICACGCGIRMDLERDKIDRDHKVALKDGGENRESNLQLLLRQHHVTKTNAEATARAAAERHKGKAFTRAKARWRSAGFPEAIPQHTATREIVRKSDRLRSKASTQ